jgi:hypothetical protein
VVAADNGCQAAMPAEITSTKRSIAYSFTNRVKAILSKIIIVLFICINNCKLDKYVILVMPI